MTVSAGPVWSLPLAWGQVEVPAGIGGVRAVLDEGRVAEFEAEIARTPAVDLVVPGGTRTAQPPCMPKGAGSSPMCPPLRTTAAQGRRSGFSRPLVRQGRTVVAPHATALRSRLAPHATVLGVPFQAASQKRSSA